MIDLLAICAHPDDLEVCAGGIFLKAVNEGKKTGLIVFTRGEAGGHATMEQRMEEFENGAKALKLDYFKQLSFPDAAVRFSDETINALIPLLRECSPKVICTLHPDDYHPDHKAVSQIVDAASFSAGLNKYSTDGSDWHYDNILHFGVDNKTNRKRPDILVDITDVICDKIKACDAHKSQEVTQFAVDLALEYGKLANCQYAEGLYINRNPLCVDSVSALIKK